MTAIWAAFRITNNTCRKNQSSANVTSHSTSSLSRSFVPICSFKLANFDPNNQIGFKYVQKPIHSFPNHVLSYISYIIYIYIHTLHTYHIYIYISHVHHPLKFLTLHLPQGLKAPDLRSESRLAALSNHVFMRLILLKSQ